MPPKILFVDDDTDLLKLSVMRLKAQQFDVIIASDGMQAVAKAHKEKPDLIVLDINMPAGNGISVYSKLKMSTNTSIIPIIFITASRDPEMRSSLEKMGAESILFKPFETDVLVEKVRQVLHLEPS